MKLLQCLITLFLLSSKLALAQQPVVDAAKLQLALKKLTVLGSVLYVAAHPDDENTSVLSYSANGRLLNTAYLSVTRGDGGQNLIGSEQSELMGVIRTQELLAARRIDGAKQFFTRAIDFGYSKSPDETLQIWDKKQILADVVWVIRKFRPDVIITRFPDNGDGGHGQHTASAILAQEAFKLAGDPAQFPEQLKYVDPWQPKRILWNAWLPAIQKRGLDPNTLVKLDIGDYNPLLGMSYTELAALSRSMHKSQGFGASGLRGETLNYFIHVDGDSAKTDLFEGINLTWSRATGGDKVGKLFERAYKEFNPENPSAILPVLLEAYSALDQVKDRYWVDVKKKELNDVIRACAGIWTEAIAQDFSAVPGSSVRIRAGIVNRSDFPITLTKIYWPHGPVIDVNKPLKRGQFMTVDSVSVLPVDHAYSQPYWLREAWAKGVFSVSDQTEIGKPENDPELEMRFELKFNGQSLVMTAPVLYRWTDRVDGESYRPFEIVLPVALQLNEKVFVFTDRLPKTIRVLLKAGIAGVSGDVKLNAPQGWKVTPDKIAFTLVNKHDETTVNFTVEPSEKSSDGVLSAVAETNMGKAANNMITISYPHIPKQTLFPRAEAKMIQLQNGKVVSKIGYIMGSGDDIPQYLAQMGYSVKLLSDDDLDNEDLSAYEAIIAGVRAYNTRPRIKQQQTRLLEYVNNGGTLLVQYNVVFGLDIKNLGPYPFKISNDRVTVEEAPMTAVNKNHPLLNFPNKISDNDFLNWVQERGLYFSNEWDSQYQTIFTCNDPGENAKAGSLLYAKYGKGIYMYTGISFFRQIPAGVPGAYRLLVNLISAGKNKLQ